MIEHLLLPDADRRKNDDPSNPCELHAGETTLVKIG
jgi:hypothetical protein